MANKLSGAGALVTGSSSGIGRATALMLAARGASVALVARRADRLEELAEEIEAVGGTALPLPADLADPELAALAVAQAATSFGRLDILVNAAGVLRTGEVTEAAAADWERMVRVNLDGVLHTTRAALPHLLDAVASSPRSVADLVNVSSVGGRTVRPGGSVYAATKHAVNAFSESLRQEVTQRSVRVSVIEPGATDTEMVRESGPRVSRDTVERFAGKRMLDPADVAEVIGFVIGRPAHVVVNEILVRPTDQLL
jgi:NADP-dependent 3-hydroxy acid dehydrogenase YdfG